MRPGAYFSLALIIPKKKRSTVIYVDSYNLELMWTYLTLP